MARVAWVSGSFDSISPSSIGPAPCFPVRDLSYFLDAGVADGDTIGLRHAERDKRWRWTHSTIVAFTLMFGLLRSTASQAPTAQASLGE